MIYIATIDNQKDGDVMTFGGTTDLVSGWDRDCLYGRVESMKETVLRITESRVTIQTDVVKQCPLSASERPSGSWMKQMAWKLPP